MTPVRDNFSMDQIKSYWPMLILMGTFLWGYSSLTTKVDYLVETNKAILVSLASNESRITRLEAQLTEHMK